MSKQLNKIYFILFGSIVFALACSKESSFETGNLYGIAQGTLKDSVGNCQGIIINGIYAADTTLTDSNYVSVIATITTPGVYKIYTDTINGFWFRDSAYVLTTGTKTFKLKGFGKPILPIASNFTVFFNTSYCLFSITPTGVGGSNAATPPAGDYFPTSVNSNWTYFNSLKNDTIRYNSTNIIKTFSSRAYHLFTSSQVDSFFYRTDSLQGTYFQYDSFPGSTLFEYKILDDKLPLNSSWETQEFTATIGGVAATYKIRFTIDAKNATFTINSKTFTNVIEVRQEALKKELGGLFSISSAFTTYTYYAKKIGIVWVDNPNSSPAYSEKIQRYSIF